MNAVQIICLYTATLGFTLAMLAFGLMAPWYKSLSGTILFTVKVCLFLILFYFSWRVTFPSQLWIRGLLYFLYPLITVTGFALTWVIVRAQYTGVQKHQQTELENQLFSKSSTESPWNGTERRSPNSPPEEM